MCWKVSDKEDEGSEMTWTNRDEVGKLCASDVREGSSARMQLCRHDDTTREALTSSTRSPTDHQVSVCSSSIIPEEEQRKQSQKERDAFSPHHQHVPSVWTFPRRTSSVSNERNISERGFEG